MKKKLKKYFGKLIMLFKKEKIRTIIVPTDKKCLLKNKIVLITGGSSGIGLAIAQACLNAGAKVVIAGTSEERLANAVVYLVNNTVGSEGRVKSIVIDVTKTETLRDKTKAAAYLYNEQRIDILVNSAGIGSKQDFWNTDSQTYDLINGINAKGTFFMSQAVSSFMIDNNIKGHILNIASSSALRPAWTPYEISKWAVRGMTLGMADTLLPYGIIVNAIAPGPTATPMIGLSANESISLPNNPSRRCSTPEEIASLAVFMISGAGDMIVGDTFYITGGSGTISLHR